MPFIGYVVFKNKFFRSGDGKSLIQRNGRNHGRES